ncbi:MFS transporter [Candidatus Bathyarchaeota archaeon]|nr:MAG: MFS transporter [Candidatus Bathyarchaeota archaeon]
MRRAGVYAIAWSHGAMHAYLVLLPALAPLIKAEVGGYAILGILISLVFLFYGWGSLPVGIMADRSQKRLMIAASMLLCGSSSLLIAIAHSLPLLGAGLILLGLGASLYHPPGYAAIALYTTETRGRYMGIQGLGGLVGMALSYITATSIGSMMGWRIPFLLWGLIGIAMGIMDLLLISEPEGGAQGGGHREWISLSVGVRRLIIVFAIIILSGALWSGVSSFLLAYISEVKGVQLLIAGGLSTISYTVGSIAQLIGGELSDRIGRRIVILIGFAAYSLLLFTLTRAPGSLPLMLLLLILLGFSFYLTQSPINALLGDVSPRRSVGATYGFNFAVKYGIGSFTPALAGYLTARYSMDYAFYLFSLISLAAFLLSLLIGEES